MADADRIVETEFVRLPKHVHPEPNEDRATVDFGAGPNEIVVLGHARNGDSRHRFGPAEIRLDADGSVEVLSVTMQITKDDSKDQLVLSGPSVYYYRLRVEFDGPLPDEYEITHLDEDGTTQFEVMEALMADPDTFLENAGGRRDDR